MIQEPQAFSKGRPYYAIVTLKSSHRSKSNLALYKSTAQLILKRMELSLLDDAFSASNHISGSTS